MIFALLFLHFLVVHKRECVYEADEERNDQDKQVGAISYYLVDHGIAVNDCKCTA